MKIVNLMPYAVTFCNGEKVTVIEPSGTTVSIRWKTVSIGEIMGIETTETTCDKIVGLPEPKDGVVYLVSSAVAQCCRNRSDIYVADEIATDKTGQVIGCKTLTQFK